MAGRGRSRLKAALLLLLAAFASCILPRHVAAQEKAMKQVFIASPMYGGKLYHGYFASVLAAMNHFSVMKARPDITLVISTVEMVSEIAVARAILCKFFLSTASNTHMFFIDNDISFTTEMIERFVDSNKPVLAAAAPLHGPPNWDLLVDLARSNRDIPEDQMAALLQTSGYPLNVDFLPDLDKPRDAEGRYPARLTPDEHGHLKVQAVGMGFVMLVRPVVERMWRSYQELTFRHQQYGDVVGFFHNSLQKGADGSIHSAASEYHAFWKRWRSLGGEIWVDTKEGVNHTTRATFDAAHFFEKLKPENPARDIQIIYKSWSHEFTVDELRAMQAAEASGAPQGRMREDQTPGKDRIEL
ncbi:unnamed protein product [Pedinophyceae sp. YPF-701]|nr:unnamed protein product [Pedinophyceae sp. YPF-701]